MAIMTVSIPDPMKDWVDQQAQTGLYSDGSDYVRDLIRRDQERSSALAELAALVDEGLESGISDRPVAEVFAEARARSRQTDLPAHTAL